MMRRKEFFRRLGVEVRVLYGGNGRDVLQKQEDFTVQKMETD